MHGPAVLHIKAVTRFGSAMLWLCVLFFQLRMIPRVWQPDLPSTSEQSTGPQASFYSFRLFACLFCIACWPALPGQGNGCLHGEVVGKCSSVQCSLAALRCVSPELSYMEGKQNTVVEKMDGATGLASESNSVTGWLCDVIRVLQPLAFNCLICKTHILEWWLKT